MYVLPSIILWSHCEVTNEKEQFALTSERKEAFHMLENVGIVFFAVIHPSVDVGIAPARFQLRFYKDSR